MSQMSNTLVTQKPEPPALRPALLVAESPETNGVWIQSASLSKKYIRESEKALTEGPRVSSLRLFRTRESEIRLTDNEFGTRESRDGSPESEIGTRESEIGSP